ncbi:MAG: hypothetical protein IRY98_12145 [Alicyclobacillaceae bacterium]|nr:hypothetical protein [Alicyclobacillaceae bacterium]
MTCWTDVHNGIIVFTMDEDVSKTETIRSSFPYLSAHPLLDVRKFVLIHVVGGCGFHHIANSPDLVNIHVFMREREVFRVAYVASDVRQLPVLMRMAKTWGVHPRASYFNHVTDALEFLESARVFSAMTA